MRLTFVCLASVTALWIESAQAAEDSNWRQDTEARLQAIYERGEFRGRTFEAHWLPDSSRYVVGERDPETNELIRVQYDVRTGERAALDTTHEIRSDSKHTLSPDGLHVLEFQERNLFVRELESGQRMQLTKHSEERDLWYRDPVWSPDGQRIAFVESDETDVRLRSVLVPSDPSYPGIRSERFARVGETIASLRVGVVDVSGERMRWLPIEAPPEGFYIGQVGWAGNSEEVLVEKLSRFRDMREFLIFNIESNEVEQIYRELNEAWAVSSQEKNSGLIWIRGGEAFIVITEKDGWRHAFLHSRDGEQLSLLTPGGYDMIERGTVDEDGGWFYFYASPDNGTQKYLYRVPLDGSGTLERITPDGRPGTHDYNFSPDSQWAFHTYSTLGNAIGRDSMTSPSARNTVRERWVMSSKRWRVNRGLSVSLIGRETRVGRQRRPHERRSGICTGRIHRTHIQSVSVNVVSSALSTVFTSTPPWSIT